MGDYDVLFFFFWNEDIICCNGDLLFTLWGLFSFRDIVCWSWFISKCFPIRGASQAIFSAREVSENNSSALADLSTGARDCSITGLCMGCTGVALRGFLCGLGGFGGGPRLLLCAVPLAKYVISSSFGKVRSTSVVILCTISNRRKCTRLSGFWRNLVC